VSRRDHLDVAFVLREVRELLGVAVFAGDQLPSSQVICRCFGRLLLREQEESGEERDGRYAEDKRYPFHVR